MNQLFGALVAFALYTVPFAVLVGSAVVARRFFHRRDRRNPLTRGLLRSPGHTLSKQLDDIATDITGYAAAGAPMPLFFYAIWQLQSEFTGVRQSPVTSTLYVVAAVAMLAFLVWKIVGLVRRGRDLRLGLEAELAVGQELNQLMKDGFTIFHDVPGQERFNIDHVAVGRQGVFSIETKGRAKPIRGDSAAYKVTFENGRLMFPGWVETEPIAQAQRNAEWLGKWLTSAVGEPVTSKAVLMLPGWYVDRKSPSEVAVMSAKDPRGFFLKQKSAALTDKLVQQIVHQLDARCRDVEIRAYVHGPA